MDNLEVLLKSHLFFAIISVFIAPFLWYRAFGLREKKIILLLLMFTYMIFLIKARTAQATYFGELILLAVFSAWGRYQDWIGSLLKIFAVTAITLGVYLSAPLAISYMGRDDTADMSMEAEFKKYVSEDVLSVASVSKRSNLARIGSTVAVFHIGMEHPVFGIGTGFGSPYIADHIPVFAQDDQEICHWLAMLRNEGFLDSSIPTFNMFGIMLMQYGICGLLLFLMPLFFISKMILCQIPKMLGQYGFVCVLVSLGGSTACLLSNYFFYTYPLVLGTTLLLCFQRDTREKSASDRD
jgi:hypothetical protein